MWSRDVADELDAARTLPLPAVDAQQVATGEFAYTTTLSLPNGEMAINNTRTVRRDTDGTRQLLIVQTESNSAMGQISDRYVLDGTSLRPIEREIVQGPATISVEFGAREVSGAIAMNGNEIPISIELEAPAFGGDAGLELALAGLPLRDGLRSVIRIVEVGAQQRVRYYRAEVTGRETVTVPQGSFDTFKIDFKAIDGEGGDQVYWISAEAPHKTIRVDGTLPAQMGGGAFTTVLGQPTE